MEAVVANGGCSGKGTASGAGDNQGTKGGSVTGGRSRYAMDDDEDGEGGDAGSKRGQVHKILWHAIHVYGFTILILLPWYQV